MNEKLKDLVVKCKEDPSETLRLNDCSYDGQVLVEMDLYDGFKSFIYVSKEDAPKIRDWWITFCEKHEKENTEKEKASNTK